MKMILRTTLPPGDVCTLTATVYSLKRQFPDFQVDVRTHHPDIWRYNPDITPLDTTEGDVIDCHYPLINRSNQIPATYIHGYCAFLAEQLEIPLTLQTNRPHFYWGHGETHREMSKRYWLISPGLKNDFTAKAWPVEHYQAVVDALRDDVEFVQIGNKGDNHPQLHGVTNLVGQTSLRELILLAADCMGGIGPSTLLQHLCGGWQRPYVCLLGGRESIPWQASYPTQATAHTIGQLDCCAVGACWKSKVVGECKYPVLDLARPVARCMAMISPEEIIPIIRRCLQSEPPAARKQVARIVRRRPHPTGPATA